MKVEAVNGLVRILKSEGVNMVSTFPTNIFNNACGEEGLPLFMVRDERYAVAVADGYSRVSDGEAFGVCTIMGGTNAAGIQMAYGALAQAYEDSVSLLCLTDGVTPTNIGRERFNIKEAFKSVTKWTGYINKAERVPEFMRRALTYLKTGRSSPVLLQLPKGLGIFDESEYPYTPVKGWKRQGNPKDVEKSVKLLKKSKQALVYVGSGVFSSNACNELLRFVELAQVPVLTTLKGKSAFPENHKLSLGVRGEPANKFLLKADLIFCLGVGFTPSHFQHVIPDSNNKKIIQCTIDESDLNCEYSIDHAILGDAKLILMQLILELEKQGAPKLNESLVKEIEDAKKVKKDKYQPYLESTETPINPYRVYNEIINVIDMKNSLVTHESGNTRDQLSTVFESQIPHGFLGWGNVSTLGYGLGGAMGAKLALPKRQVINVTGDAGVGYQMGNWETMVRYKMGITTIHINNNGFGGYGPGFWGPGHSPFTSELTSHQIQSTAKVAEALGINAERVYNPDEIEPAIKRAIKANASNKPYLLEIICSRHPIYSRWLR